MDESDKQELTHRKIILREPIPQDAAWIWRLVRETGVLDLNSSYLYLLLCRDFSKSCIVAVDGLRVVGFITGYRLPESPRTLFVWQVGVSQSARRRGIASRMLTALIVNCHQHAEVEYLEATVAADNQASRRLFRKYAEQHGLDFMEETGFTEADFGFGDHAAEPRLRIGPLHHSVFVP